MLWLQGSGSKSSTNNIYPKSLLVRRYLSAVIIGMGFAELKVAVCLVKTHILHQIMCHIIYKTNQDHLQMREDSQYLIKVQSQLVVGFPTYYKKRSEEHCTVNERNRFICIPTWWLCSKGQINNYRIDCLWRQILVPPHYLIYYIQHVALNVVVGRQNCLRLLFSNMFQR